VFVSASFSENMWERCSHTLFPKLLISAFYMDFTWLRNTNVITRSLTSNAFLNFFLEKSTGFCTLKNSIQCLNISCRMLEPADGAWRWAGDTEEPSLVGLRLLPRAWHQTIRIRIFWKRRQKHRPAIHAFLISKCFPFSYNNTLTTV